MLLPKLYVLLMLQDGDQGPADRCFESSSSPTQLPRGGGAEVIWIQVEMQLWMEYYEVNWI